MRIEGINQTSPIQSIRPINQENQQQAGNEKKSNKLAHEQNNTEQNKFTEEEMIKAIESANEKIELHDTRLEFSIHEKTKEIMVKIIDEKNDKVIKEIPPEKILDMIAGLMELAGLIVDKKA